MKEIERLKEQSKRNNWRMQNKERVGQMQTNNAMMYKVGEGMLSRLNLGGAGGGLNRPAGGEVSMSTNNLNLGGKIGGGEMGTYRATLGVDKSMDNFKMGFSQNFGSQLGLGNKNADAMSATSRGAAQTFGAVSQPMNLGQAMNNNQLENSMRQSNILSTPSSKGQLNDDDDYEK